MELDVRRVAVLSAPAAVGVSALGVAVVAVLVPFDPLTQAISELGELSSPHSIFFNVSLIAAGLVALPFAGVLAAEARNAYETVGAVLLAASFVGLSGVGALPYPGPFHGAAAVVFYMGFTFALWVNGTGEVLAGDERRGLVSVWLANANAFVWLSYVVWSEYVPGLAVPEALGAFVFVVWLFLTARRLYAYNSEA